MVPAWRLRCFSLLVMLLHRHAADGDDDDDDQFHRRPHHRGLDHHLCHEQHHYRQRRCIAVIIGIFTISITIITMLDAAVFPSSSSATFSSDFSFSP